MLIVRRSNCVVTASGIVTFRKQPFSAPVESGLQFLFWMTDGRSDALLLHLITELPPLLYAATYVIYNMYLILIKYVSQTFCINLETKRF
jgi:hypothetical protein